jgi:phenylacetate-coenzyme A ligase PaaK-like adenylate-forming protein
MLAVPPGEIARIVTLKTSGTTSAPKRVYFTSDDLEFTADFFNYGMRRIVGASDKVCCLFPGETIGSVGELLARGLSRIPVTVVPTPELATCVVGAPAQLMSLPQMRLNSVLLTAEYVSAEARAEVRARFNCEIYEHYGLTESGLGFAVSCSPDVDFYHVRERDLYAEIIDPVTLRPAPDGELGEIVFTTLNAKGMPLVRYRTGDISSMAHGRCPLCGSATPRLSRVADRGVKKRT